MRCDILHREIGWCVMIMKYWCRELGKMSLQPLWREKESNLINKGKSATKGDSRQPAMTFYAGYERLRYAG